MKITVALIALSACISSAANAGQDISAEGAWARATAKSAQTGAVYLTIIDKSGADELLSVTTPVAGSAKVHETFRKNGVAGMRPVETLPVSNAGPTMLAPGGFHIMLMGLKSPLERGKSFPIILMFKKAGKVDAMVRVEAADAGGPTQDVGPGHDLDKQ